MSKDITSLRDEIDQLDEQLWEIIGKRADIVRQVGEWKRKHGERVLQPERWLQVVQHCQDVAKKYNLSETLVQEVMEAIHNESVRIES
jgi:chorismate mutase